MPTWLLWILMVFSLVVTMFFGAYLLLGFFIFVMTYPLVIVAIFLATVLVCIGIGRINRRGN